MNSFKDFSLASKVNQALPDNRIIKLSGEQLESLKTVSKIALIIIGVAGIVSAAVVAPNLLKAVNLFLPKKNRYKKLSREEKIKKVEDSFYYLKRSGLVNFKENDGSWFLSLTNLGKQRLPKLNINSLLIAKPKEWDKRWWLVAADIPTKDYRKGADYLRRKLKVMGFYPMQRTLWLYPFDPRREIQFIIETSGIANFVTVIKVEQLDIEDEANAKNYFKNLKII